MPQIRTYEAPQGLGLNPTETGIEATAQAGNRIGRFYNQAASATQEVGNEAARGFSSAIKDAGDVAVQYAEHREISHGAAAFAELNDGLTQAWNDTAKSANPNDPTVAAKFRQDTLEPALDKYRESFLTEGGQKFAEQHIDSLRNHMFEKTSADMSSLAADAVSVNVRQTANSLSNTAVNDPSSVPHLLDSADSMIGGMVDSSPNLKGEPAAKARMELTQKMKENIVKSGAIGAIQKSADPEATAAEWSAKYPDYINGDEIKMLAGNARQQIRAARIDQAYSDTIEKKAAQQKSDATEVGYLQSLYSDDPKQQGQVSTKTIVNDPNLTRESKERMIGVVNREFKPETDAKISAQSSTALFRAMSDPNADTDKVRASIIAARGKDPGEAGSINKSDFTDLMKNLEDVKTPQGAALAQDRTDFFKRYAGAIDPSLSDAQSPNFGHFSALGSQKMYDAEKSARRMEDNLRKAGQDPHSLYDPSSPNFFGKPANIMKYRATMQDSAAYQASISAAPSAAPPANTNLTGPDKTITGVTVEDAPAFKPPANWQYSASRGQYRDPDGKLYDKSGKLVK